MGISFAAVLANRLKTKVTPIFGTPDPQYTQTPVGLSPFIRENDINFAAKNLKPDTTANFFFDETSVNYFCQRASCINVASSSALSNVRVNEGIFNANSNAYAQILGTSRTATDNYIYLNENFISVNLARGAANTNLTSSEYAPGELVYQTTTGAPVGFSAYTGFIKPQFTFVGKVVKWKSIDTLKGTLVIEPLEGALNTSTSISNVIWNMTRANSAAPWRHAQSVWANSKFSSGDTIVYASNDATITAISTSNSYVGVSGSVPIVNTGNLNSLIISSNNFVRDGIATTTNLNGKTVRIVSGNNMGFQTTVSANVFTTFGTVAYNELTLANSLPQNLSSNSIYSIDDHVVDSVGSLHGIFHIPSDERMRWLTGERLFTITDTATHNDNGYTMRAVAKYTALGKVNSTENARNFVLREQTPSTAQAAPSVIQETQKINDRKFMAQTFFTPKASEIVDGQVKASYGMYLTSVELFFKSKPTDAEEQLPFTVAISRVESGLPGNDIVAERTLEPAYVNVSANTPSSTNSSASTKFTFTDPVYLLPSNEYAIKLITESPDYEVWTATMGDDYTDELGNIRKISDQPYVGNFFKSQNASNWNPILNQDLMFKVNRAVFESSNTIYFNVKTDEDMQRNVLLDELRLAVTEQQLAPTTTSYEVKTILASTGEEQSYVTVIPNSIYKFGKDTNVSTVTSKRRRVIPTANGANVTVKVTMSTTDNSVSPIINRERFGLLAIQNIVNNAGISNNMISITSGGTHSCAASIVVTFSPPDVGANTATGNVLPSMLSGSTVTGINIINPGAGYFTAPTVTLAEATSSANATAVVNGETDNSTGGNILSGYQTKIVELAEGINAGDLIVRLDAIRPPGTDIGVYFKVLSPLDKDPFASKKWQKMTKVNELYSLDQNQNVRLEYRFAPDGLDLLKGEIEYFEGDKAYPLGKVFKYFAIKLRLTAQDPTVVPLVDSLKVLAVPGESEPPTISGGGY